MLKTFKNMITAPDPHQPCDLHRQESASLRSELHHSYDRERQQRNAISRLQADNHRLERENSSLKLSQQQSIIEEMTDRILEQKLLRETPTLTLPCIHHQTAGFNFATPAR